MPSTADAVAGSLLGLALGDALGFAVEGAPRRVAAAYADDLIRRGQAAYRDPTGFHFGQYSDDTQLARVLLASGHVGADGTVPTDVTVWAATG